MMLDKMKQWFNSTGRDRNEILNRLTSESVKAGKNKRIGDTSGNTGHVHNSMLPEGGLQQVLSQHKIHVVSCPHIIESSLTQISLARTSSMQVKISSEAKR